MLNDAPQAGDPIKDVTTASFRQDVIAESMQQPVLVDFWAPWCGPCKQLAPVLEKVVQAAAGAVKLVKMNIDEHPSIAGQLGIQSIPAVIAFDKGQPVDGFMGAVPEAQIKDFIGRLAGPAGPSPIEEALSEADAMLGVGDTAGAAQLYAAVLTEEPENITAIAALAKLQLDLGAIDKAREVLALAPAEKANDPALVGVRAALDLAEKAAELGDLGEFQRRIEADPADHQARFDLALGLNGLNKRDEAVDQLIEIERRDRAWNEGAARKQLLTFFEAWGLMDKASIRGRRRLSTLVFA
ncbi:Thiol:disulfide interchange protein DsbD [Methylobacterium adhaesivum]|jgi:putative thioredoxin|uniref:Thioredoxin n=1 Tax=Methylobacterium adhaesivum TaxID=333297 RepID=A0ABT8BCQ5_9HYPH|nr:thioredoxin [Methylobacterium adhaesivum]MDN3589678.1 thioredoxin [Methylobacterium adhaesivum]GJD32932.1 Thiol:disulfide interchange protein DsbD [Methylobacterium adhaesivum]